MCVGGGVSWTGDVIWWVTSVRVVMPDGGMTLAEGMTSVGGVTSAVMKSVVGITSSGKVTLNNVNAEVTFSQFYITLLEEFQGQWWKENSFESSGIWLSWVPVKRYIISLYSIV